MKLDIHERDIDSQLCQTCAACCRVTLKIRDTGTRYRQFLRQIGYTVIPPTVSGKADCCDKKHDVTLDMDFCKHLRVSTVPGGGQTYQCAIYGAANYPELCEQFNCVSWAKAHENYSQRNSLLVKAQQALNRLRDNGLRPYGKTGLFTSE